MIDRRQFFLLTGLSVLGFGVRTALGKGDSVQHWSDCATNSEPAYPAGPCDCFHVGARIEHKKWGGVFVVAKIADDGFYYESVGGRSGGHVGFTAFKNWRKIG